MSTKTKTKEKEVEKKTVAASVSTTAVVKATPRAAPPAEMMDELRETAGQGISTDSRDTLIPLLYVLQPLSPQISVKSDKYIKGSEPGDVLLRGAAEPILHVNDDDDPTYFQPCIFDKQWVEWIHRDEGGGFVGRHEGDEDHPPQGSVKKIDPKRKNKPASYTINDGHQLVFTRNHGGYVIRPKVGLVVPYIIPLSSTGHAVSRELMRLMTEVPPIPGVGRPPSWVKMYRMKTRHRSNNRGEWHVLQFSDIGDEGYLWHDPAAMARGRAMFEAWKAGTVKAEAPEDQQHDGSDDGDNGSDEASRAGI